MRSTARPWHPWEVNGLARSKAENLGELQIGLAAGHQLRWAVTDVTGVLEEARQRLDLSPLAAVALGRALAGAALLLRLSTKIPTKLALQFRGAGPLRSVLAEANDAGHLRGMVGEPRVRAAARANAKLAVAPALGPGTLRVVREQDGGNYESQVRLVSGEMGKDLAHYLAQSEQRRSAVLLGVLAKPGGIAAAGGVIVEALPGSDEKTLGVLEGNIARFSSPSRVLESGGLTTLLGAVLSELGTEVIETRELTYRCDCSREGLLRHLAYLSSQELAYLTRGGHRTEVECAFCGTSYRYAPEELKWN